MWATENSETEYVVFTAKNPSTCDKTVTTLNTSVSVRLDVLCMMNTVAVSVLHSPVGIGAVAIDLALLLDNRHRVLLLGGGCDKCCQAGQNEYLKQVFQQGKLISVPRILAALF
jgi:hypothetical protein